MNIIIYIDVLFLLNFIVDYIVLSSTAFILNQKNSTIRFFSASFVGALYSTIIFFPQLKILTIIIFKIIVSFVIVLIAFKWKSFIAQIKFFITFYLIKFLYGGGMFAFYRFTSLGSKMNFSNGEYYINLPLWAIIILSIIFYLLIKLFTKILNGVNQDSIIKELEIKMKNKSVCVKALIDTGNNLYDPISQYPVMLVEKSIIKKIINVDYENDYTCIQKHNMRIVPFFDASGQSSIIYAFKPTHIINKENNTEITNLLIGITPHKLSADNSYQALLHSKVYKKEQL